MTPFHGLSHGGARNDASKHDEPHQVGQRADSAGWATVPGQVAVPHLSLHILLLLREGDGKGGKGDARRQSTIKRANPQIARSGGDNKEQIQIDTGPNPEACRESPSGLGAGRVGKWGLEQGVGKGGGGEGKCDAHTTRLALRNIRQIWRIR